MQNALLAGSFLATGGGGLVTIVVEYLKHAEWATFIQADQKGRIKTTVVLLTAAAGFLSAWSSGSLDNGALLGLVSAVVMIFQSFGISTAVYQYFLKK